MKKAVLFLALLGAVSAEAAQPVCPTIEFAELQTYSVKELDEAIHKNIARGTQYLNAPMSEHENCTEQNKRIRRVLNAKKEAAKKEAEAKEAAEKAKAETPAKK